MQEYSYSFDEMKNHTSPLDTNFSEMCPGGKIQVAKRLFKFAVCHSTNDQVGRRKRRPSKSCPYAIVGIRATVMLDQLAHMIEESFGLPDGEMSDLSGISNQFRSTFHQSFVYGDDQGHLDYSSGFFCGEGTMVGRQWGYICQDDDRLVQMYVPITNNSLALDNWFPRQYHLVGRKFDCDRLWRAEMQMSKKYDACAAMDTAVDYSAIVRNCHMYVNEVVDLYDTMTADEGKLAIDHAWSPNEIASLEGMHNVDAEEGLKRHVEEQLKVEANVWGESHPGNEPKN